jgi:hypothetical protein
MRRSSWPLVAAVVVSPGEVAAAGEGFLPCRPPAEASAAGTTQDSSVWCQRARVLTAVPTILLAGSAQEKQATTWQCACELEHPLAQLVRAAMVHGRS